MNYITKMTANDPKRTLIEEKLLMDNSWQIENQPQWDGSKETLKITVKNGNEKHLCAFPQTAINDYYHTVDTKDAAFENFANDRQKFLDVALKFISKNNPNDDGIYYIGGSNFI